MVGFDEVVVADGTDDVEVVLVVEVEVGLTEIAGIESGLVVLVVEVVVDMVVVFVLFVGVVVVVGVVVLVVVVGLVLVGEMLFVGAGVGVTG